MLIRECLLLMMLSPGSSFVLMPKNATGRVAGDLTQLSGHAYRWDMPEARPPLTSPSSSPSPSLALTMWPSPCVLRIVVRSVIDTPV